MTGVLLPIIVRATYRPDQWTDAADRPQWAYEVEDFALGLTITDDPPVAWDNGYGPSHSVECHTWKAADENRRFLAIPPTDIGASMTYLEIRPPDTPTVQFFQRPALGRPYSLDGKLWDPIAAGREAMDILIEANKVSR